MLLLASIGGWLVTTDGARSVPIFARLDGTNATRPCTKMGESTKDIMAITTGMTFFMVVLLSVKCISMGPLRVAKSLQVLAADMTT